MTYQKKSIWGLIEGKRRDRTKRELVVAVTKEKRASGSDLPPMAPCASPSTPSVSSRQGVCRERPYSRVLSTSKPSWP